MLMFLYLFIVITGLGVLALVMPVKVYLKASGGSDKGFEVAWKVMFFYGMVGGGLHYFGKVYRACIYLFSWKVLDINITSFAGYIGRKAKKRPEKVKEKKEHKPFLNRLGTFYRNKAVYRGYFLRGLHDFRDIFRFEKFSANIKLGLGNPFITGKIIGIIFALNNVLPKSCVINPSWDFTHHVVQGTVSLSITVMSPKFWIKLISYMPEIVRKIIERQRLKSFPITQEV
jgi:hypothetical protein